MFNLFSFIDKVKQALFMKLISMAAKAQSAGLPMIKQSAFLHQIETKKLRASNDQVSENLDKK